MVAYSFAPIFAPQVAALTKRQTVRADRRRHARPGEPIQLYTGMRMRQSQKLVDHDPICTAVRTIGIEASDLIDDIIAAIIIDGRALHRDEIEAFAAADGFAPIDYRLFRPGTSIPATARSNMGDFWRARRGLGRFWGVLIQWEPAP